MAEFIGICFFTGQRKVCGDVKALHYIITLCDDLLHKYKTKNNGTLNMIDIKNYLL